MLFGWSVQFFAHNDVLALIESKDIHAIYPMYQKLRDGHYDHVMPEMWHTLGVRSKMPPADPAREKAIVQQFIDKPPDKFWRYITLFNELTNE